MHRVDTPIPRRSHQSPVMDSNHPSRVNMEDPESLLDSNNRLFQSLPHVSSHTHAMDNLPHSSFKESERQRLLETLWAMARPRLTHPARLQILRDHSYGLLERKTDATLSGEIEREWRDNFGTKPLRDIRIALAEAQRQHRREKGSLDRPVQSG